MNGILTHNLQNTVTVLIRLCVFCLSFLALQLSSDQLYLTAIRNLARPSASAGDSIDHSLNGSSAAEGPSQLAKSYNSEKAKSMLYSIKNKEMAIAAAKWIAQQLPLGLYSFSCLFNLLYLKGAKIHVWVN